MVVLVFNDLGEVRGFGGVLKDFKVMWEFYFEGRV